MFRMPAPPATCVGMHVQRRRLVKDLIPVSKIVNITVNMIAYHSGHYRDAQSSHHRKLCPATVRRDLGRRAGRMPITALSEYEICPTCIRSTNFRKRLQRTSISMTLMGAINNPDASAICPMKGHNPSG